MAKIKFSYFDLKGNRGQTARLAFDLAGDDFEDVRLSFADFKERKDSYPFGALPVIEVDGHIISQCNGINRYVGKRCGLYPEDAVQAAFCDEAMDGVEEIYNLLGKTMSMDDAEKKSARESLSQNEIPKFLKGLAGCLDRRGGVYFADGRLTVADLKSFVLLHWLQGYKLDHVPRDVASTHAPTLVSHYNRIWDMPKIRAHYDD